MNLDALRNGLAGEVVAAGSPGYDSARKPAMAEFERIHPRAVVFCENPSDVAETLAFARAAGVHVTPRSGGHCFAGRSSTEGIVIDVSRMSSVSVSDGVVTVGAGARLGGLYDDLQRHGLTLPLGCGPTVGIAGLTLGGGIGFLGRAYGLTCDRLLGARIVLADGRIVDCDEHHDADLFWALRGAGGGQFGVVTSLDFDPLPAPDATTFHLTWSYRAAHPVIAAWQEWAPFAPDELNARLRIAATGGPEPLPVVHLFGAMIGTASDTLALLEQFVTRVGLDPTSSAHRELPYREAKRTLLVGLGADDEEPDGPVHLFHRSEFFRRPLPADCIAALQRELPLGRRGETRGLNLTPLGGAYNRIPSHATAFVHRTEQFLVEHVLTVTPDAPHRVKDWVSRSWAHAHPWSSGRVYPNFPDRMLADWAQAYHGANLERLLRVKHAYDPDNQFRFTQSL